MCDRIICAGALGALLLLAPCQADARILLMDGRLEFTGYAREYMLARTHIPEKERGFHKSSIDFAQSSFLLEGLCRIRDQGGVTVNFFGGLRSWYEKAPAWDTELKRSIPHRARRDYLRPRGEEHVTEAYLDISQGPWQVLLGKQIVVWGETDLVRTADVVNPLDLRYSLPGIDFWEEMKQGLWMFRWIYRTGLPGSLLLETILIPGDFKYLQLPLEGTHWGMSPAVTSLNPGKGFGYGHWLLEKMRRDAPGWSLKDNYEWGLRVRGHTANVDWTLFCFDTLSDTATANPARALQFSLAYVSAGIRSRATGSSLNPGFPGYRVFRYKRYRVVGGTAQTFLQWLHGSIWRLEWFYESGQHFNKAAGGQLGGIIYDEVRRDSGGLGVNYADKYRIPWVTHAWFGDKQLEVSMTLYYEKIFNYRTDLVVDHARGHRIGESHAAFFIWNLIQPIRHNIWTFICAGYYNPNGIYFVLPLLSYAPGNHWRCEAGAAAFGDRLRDAQHPYRDKDSILLRVRYEW